MDILKVPTAFWDQLSFVTKSFSVQIFRSSMWVLTSAVFPPWAQSLIYSGFFSPFPCWKALKIYNPSNFFLSDSRRFSACYAIELGKIIHSSYQTAVTFKTELSLTVCQVWLCRFGKVLHLVKSED